MQALAPDLIVLLAVGSFVLIFLAAAYIHVTLRGAQKVAEAERSKYEEVVRSEKKYRSLFENSVAGIVTFNLEDWSIINTNRAFRNILGCESHEELLRTVARIPAGIQQRVKEGILSNKSVDNFEFRATRKDGEEVWLLLSANVLPEKDLGQALVIDITERKHYEEKIREQSDLLNQTQDAILVIDWHGTIEYWNSGAASTYGWKQDEAIGRSVVDLLYADAGKKEFLSSMEDINRFKEWSGEQIHRRKDGKEILVDSHWKTVEGKSNGSALVMVVSSDITEKRRLEQQSVRAQKMESIAVLTGGIAHDLHNILAPLNLSIHVLRSKLRGKYGAAVIKGIQEPVQDGMKLVKNILTYSKGISGERVRIDLRDILEQTLERFRQESPENILIVGRFKGHCLPILGDPTQLKQVFLNLCVNARDAMPEGGTLTIEARRCDTSDATLDRFPGAEKVPYVEVSVADTGKGIHEEDLERVFEPFFTTREGAGGTGLGLSVVHGIVSSHKGHIAVESSESKGTLFRIIIPCIADKPQ